LAQYDINLREYWRILKKRKLVVMAFAIGFGLFSVLLTVLKAPEPIYASVCSIKFEREATVEGLFASAVSNPIDTQMTVIKSYPILQRAAEEMGLIPHGAVEGDGQLKEEVIPAIERIQSAVKVSREEYTDILNIEVQDKAPSFAQRLANTIALSYKNFHAEEQTRRTSEALKYIQDQLATVREDLRLSEEEFNRFAQQNQLISLDMQSEVLLRESQGIQDNIRELDEDKRELEGIKQRLGQFIEDPSGSGHDFHSTKASKQYQGVNDTLLGLLLQKDTLLEDFTPQHPEVVEISRKIIENARKMSLLLQLDVSGIEKKRTDFEKELEDLEQKNNVFMDKKLEYDRLKRRVDSFNDRTVLLETKEQEALIRKAEKPEEVTIVKQALLPTHPVNPPRRVATGAMGVVIGLLVGIIIGFVVETFDTSLGAIEDVEETLGTQVLGIIPQADGKDIHESLRERYPDGIKEGIENQLVYLVSHFVPKSMMAESFRALRTNVQFKDADKKVKSIAVASTSPEEGKTLVTANLAMTMAQAGMKILLVGSDLRKPVIDRLFGVERTPGLTDVLMGNYPWRDTVKTVTDIIMGHLGLDEVMMTPGLDNLHIITSGSIPPNPSELIDSQHLTDFLEEAREEYDMVIFDSPPILSTADAAILAAKVDGVLLVYRVGAVSRGLLRRSKAQLDRVHCDLIGVVLNGMRPDVSPDFQDYKYYSYNYSYGEEDKYGNLLGRVQEVFLKWKRGRSERASQKVSFKDHGERGLKKKARMSNRTKLTLVVVAVSVLTIGILRLSGVIGTPKPSVLETPIEKKTVKPADRRGPPEQLIKRESRRVASEGETALSKNVPQAAVIKTPIPESSSEKGTSKPNTEVTVGESRIETKLPVTQSLFPYSILLSHCRNLASAEEVVSQYTKGGFDPYWVEIEVSSGIWYRVFVGYFEDREKAETFKEEHGLDEGRIMETAYANLIGVYGPSEQLQDKMRSLRDLGYSPYVTKDYDEKSRLFVGAFLTKEGAEIQYQNLKASGIENQILER
jgi:succinoglycan biosynthesis transport protein ExoP